MMGRSSIILQLIRRKTAAGILRRGGGGGGRMMSTVPNPSPQVSPWLMLPPTFDRSRGGMIYNFYSLADDEVVLVDKYGGRADPVESPDDDARVVGSSHGWLALMNRRNNDLFLSNPISRRHIKLPPIESLPHPELNLRLGGRGHVSKVIISASLDNSECRAMMSFGPYDHLAFCQPGRSEAWTPIGKLFMEKEVYGCRQARPYEDFVHSTRRRNLFHCLATSAIDGEFILEEWDLRVPESPVMGWIQNEGEMEVMEHDEYHWLEEEGKSELFINSGPMNSHLAYAEESDELFLLHRYTSRDGVTIGFLTAKVERGECGKTRLVPCSLEGLAAFVGANHSFVAAAAALPHLNLKPNSIYFTDHRYHHYVDVGEKNYSGNGGDIGIFNCVHGTLSSCYYPLLKDPTTATNTIDPAPIWFTPAP